MRYSRPPLRTPGLICAILFFSSLALYFVVVLCSCTTDDWRPFFFSLLPLAFRQSGYRSPFPQAASRDRRIFPTPAQPKKKKKDDKKREKNNDRLRKTTFRALFHLFPLWASLSLCRGNCRLTHGPFGIARPSTRTNLASGTRLILGTTIAMAFLQAFKFGSGLWDPSHRYETSWLLPPWLLFVCRALFVRQRQTTPTPLIIAHLMSQHGPSM